ncbi:MAG TPA: hypothetical protein VK986_07625 [Tepidisphaeraceae bacterium]|nr:hypothetical protein [Tepidisphaeraceae bacterium]
MLKQMNWLFCVVIGVAVHAEPPKTAAPPELLLDVEKADWKGSSRGDVRAVLVSAADQMLPYFPGAKIERLRVTNPGGPIVLYERDKDGAVRVKLDTGANLWAQTAFQFAHELTHVLCRFRTGSNPNKWLEESLCETGSLFTLRRMGEAWKVKPPYANWKDYSKSLTAYADERVKAATLPAGTSLAEWYKENEPALRKTATDRPRNTTVAVVLLGILERSPESWAAVYYLNQGAVAKDESIAACLARWHAQAPKEHRAFVREVGRALGVEVSASPL